MASRKPPRSAKGRPAPRKTTANARAKVVSKRAAQKTKPLAKKPTKKPLAKKPTRKPVTKKPLTKKPTKKPLAKKPAKKVSKAAAKTAAAVSEARRSSAAQATAARDALSTLAQKRAIQATLEPSAQGKAVVDAYMRDVDHPFKAELEAVRQIIVGASPKIAERIKWNAPSFYHKEDLGAFNPRATEYAHLILLFPGGAGMADDGLLEGKHKDRREVKFYGMDDVLAKKPALEKLVKRWVALRDR
jgi:hypothetical protein